MRPHQKRARLDREQAETIAAQALAFLAQEPQRFARFLALTGIELPALREQAGTPEILAAIRTSGRGTAVVVGCETDVCVAQSAIGLRDEGFVCVVVTDATFSPGEMHARGLERVAADGVARNHAKGIAYEWLGSVERARAVLADPALPSPPFHL